MRRTYKPIITNIMADGAVISYEDFMAAPVRIGAQENYEFHCEANRVLDPNYFEKERIRRRHQSIQTRRAELKKQQEEISNQLTNLT